MEFRTGGDAAERVQVEVVVQVLVDVLQHLLHADVMVRERRVHRSFLRGNAIGADDGRPRPTDLAVPRLRVFGVRSASLQLLAKRSR